MRRRARPWHRGPSGCGKTTLLDMLAGKKTMPYMGEVFLNGKPRDHLFSRVTSYVPHEDVMPPPYWTVTEAVEFNHRLRIEAGGMSNEARKSYVEEVLSSFGLMSVKDSYIGDDKKRGISGGEKRRVRLARGFVGGSQIVFADEPTSGLSATDAEICVRVMSAASRKEGVMFVVVIHQPRVEVTAMFDHLTLMTSHPGRMVYNGPFGEVAAYFATGGSPPPTIGNPADFYLGVITPDVPGSRVDVFVDLYDREQKGKVDGAVSAMISKGGKGPLQVLQDVRDKRMVHVHSKADPVKDSKYSVPLTTQLGTLLRRRVTLTVRDKRQLGTRLVVSVLQGLIIGTAFFDIGKKLPAQQLAFIFLALQMGTLSNMMVMPEMIAQRMLFKVESADALYSTVASVLVDTLVSNILGIVGNVITIVIMFSLSGFGWNWFGHIYFWTFVNFMTMTNFYKIIAAISPSASESLQIAMPGLMLFILFNNFFVNRATAPFFMKWALYVSPMAWSIEQIITGMYANEPFLVQLYGYDSSDRQTATALTVLISEAVLFQLISLVCLRYCNNIVR